MRPEIDPRYAAAQLAQSLRAAHEHTDPALRADAEKRVRHWLDVLAGMASGALRVGDRQPYEHIPTWVTPVVMRGGFASADFAAGGALLDHERAAAGAVQEEEVRLAANGHFLTREGQTALTAFLDDGSYRVSAPEESALLALRWLIERGEHAQAAAVLEALAPFFDRLRFHPRPASPRPPAAVGIDAPVLVETAASVARALRSKAPSANVEAMREAHEIWAPLTDAMIALVRSTVVDGMPFRTTPADFETRRASLLAAYANARAEHTRCKRPHRRGEVLEVMHRALAADDAARGWTVSQVKTRLDDFERAYGAPGSASHHALRDRQRVGPSHASLAHAVAERLDAVPEGEGIEDGTAFVGPVVGTPMEWRVRGKVSRAKPTPIAKLGVSAEGMATLVPQLVGPTLAARFDDPRARTLYASAYRAFAQRRSLLLTDLQHQVRFGELPWIAAMETLGERASKETTRTLLVDLASLAITRYPATQMPNKLVSQLAALAKTAELDLPLVEELAADIFMGRFSPKFARAAQIAARVLGPRSLYARYYDLPYDELPADFDALCFRLATLPAGGNVAARNGCVIEQASILTTHNLAVLVDGLALDLDWPSLARAALREIFVPMRWYVLRPSATAHARLRASRQIAFGWRQMLFFLSRGSDDEINRFVAEATSVPHYACFIPFFATITRVLDGGSLPHAERLYGWSVGPHILRPPPASIR